MTDFNIFNVVLIFTRYQSLFRSRIFWEKEEDKGILLKKWINKILRQLNDILILQKTITWKLLIWFICFIDVAKKMFSGLDFFIISILLMNKWSFKLEKTAVNKQLGQTSLDLGIKFFKFTSMMETLFYLSIHIVG